MNSGNGKSGPNGKLGQVQVLELRALRPAPENDAIYRPISADDSDIQKLAASIGEHGVLEPLVVSRDRYILSGHRRHFAAALAGVERRALQDRRHRP